MDDAGVADPRAFIRFHRGVAPRGHDCWTQEFAHYAQAVRAIATGRSAPWQERLLAFYESEPRWLSFHASIALLHRALTRDREQFGDRCAPKSSRDAFP